MFDVLRRYLEFRGLDVRHVSNITDIDDKIIKRAAEEGRTEAEVAAQYEALWWEAMDALGVKRPTDTPHATAFVRRDGGVASPTSSTAASPTRPATACTCRSTQVDGYGLLAHQSLDSLRAGARVEPGEEKRSPVDFALWKKARPGRAHLGLALGAGPTGLAHRVRGHVARPPR